jgi:type IV pilus assembly protein PilF
LNKKPIIMTLFCAAILFCSCTNTPWHKERSEIFLNKGISFIELAQYNSALKDLLEAAKYSPDDPRVHYFLGMAYLGKGMREKASEEFQEAISLKENYSEAHNYLGAIYMDMGLWDKAIEEFNKALANPTYDTPVMPLYNSGWAYYNKKNYSAALAKYRQALGADPATTLRPQIEKNIGLIYYDQANIPEAIVHLNKSVELDPQLYDAHFLLAECYLKVQNSDLARISLQKVIKLSPNSSLGQKAKTYMQSLK